MLQSASENPEEIFGGSRGSFHGDLKAQGKDAVELYTDKRVVISRW